MTTRGVPANAGLGGDARARCVPLVAMADLDRGWQRCDPGRDRTMIPYTDADTATLVDRAVAALVMVRAPMWLGDPGPTVSVLVSLAAEAESRLWDAVADSRDRGYSWDQVASRLAVSVATARRRYAGYVAWRTTVADAK